MTKANDVKVIEIAPELLAAIKLQEAEELEVTGLRFPNEKGIRCAVTYEPVDNFSGVYQVNVGPRYEIRKTWEQDGERVDMLIGVKDHFKVTYLEAQPAPPQLTKDGDLDLSDLTVSVYLEYLHRHLLAASHDAVTPAVADEIWTLCDGYGPMTIEQLRHYGLSRDWSHIRDSSRWALQRAYLRLKWLRETQLTD